MEPVSAVASIGQIIDLTFKVAQYLKDIKDAPAARRKLQREVNSLLSLLNDLQYRIEEADMSEPWFQSLCSLTTPNDVLDQIKAVTKELEDKLCPVGTMKKIGRVLTWTLDKKETDDMLSRIDRLKSDIIISLQKDHFMLSRATDKRMVDVHKDVLEIANNQKEEAITGHRLLVADWISRLSFHQTHAAALSRRKTAGAGKTIIAATAIDFIKTECLDTNTGVAFIYCNYKEQPDQTAVNLISSLLKQLTAQKPSILDNVASLHKQHSSQNTRPAIIELLKELQSAVSSFANVYIIIDALDECSEENRSREELLESLGGLPEKTHLMFTSRPHIRIDRSFAEMQELEIIANIDDVQAYIDSRISQSQRLVLNINQRPDIREMIKEKVSDKTKGMFLLARLHMDSVSKKSSPKTVIQALNDLSTSLDEAYKKALERIDTQGPEDRQLAIRTIYWITLAKASLTISELQHTLAVEGGSSRLDKDAIVNEETLLSVCAGLVAIDPNSSTVSLVHYTTQDYFISIQEKLYPNGPLEIATTCLTYLLFEDFSTGACTTDNELLGRLNDNALLKYAARYWGEHTRGEIELTINKIVLELLQDTSRLSCCVQITQDLSYRYKDSVRTFQKGYPEYTSQQLLV